MTDERTRRIQERAHSIWEQEGRPHGQDAQHWSQAEYEIDAEDAAGASSPAGTTAMRRGSKRRAGAKTVANTSNAGREQTTDTTAEVLTEEPARTKGRKPKAVTEDGTKAPKAARGQKARAVPEEATGSSTAAGDAEPKVTTVAEENIDPNREAPQDAGQIEEPVVAPKASRMAE
ncbi:DUF2934 domain-containing protein [Paracoccus benzoatiresistens]|uniref:DUF2934 domain-containing protein n=1 Tax=Paracoccus benzoatiresistens TaxID=2997341 RepID=A0ABT4J938_9RHOB|nr:DUF2934 domain-containing protein [Paracoccus sp. EF6]MCZ0963429.1 DUF2934 domain-containing protein [Paracoccus sp. EF6]